MLSLADIEAARARIQSYVHTTPMRHSVNLSKLTGAQLFFKYENQQRTGSFKIRGAMNKILTLSAEERRRGVIAASAGNHAQGVALAASTVGVKATVVMSAGASLAKVAATRGYGAEVILHGNSYDDAYQKALGVQKEKRLTFVHAYNDEAVMAGQGTVGLEILEQLPDVDAVVCGVGGGGLIAGIATAVKAKRPKTHVFGVQPARTGYLPKSLKAGKIVPSDSADTIADGLATKKGGDLTFEVMKRLLDGCVTVSEEEIAHAILVFLERQKSVVEGAGAVGLAALLGGKLPKLKGKKVAVVVSGGNIDINSLDGIIARGLHEAGRRMRVRVVIDDRPGQLKGLLEVMAVAQSNILDIRHTRNDPSLPLNKTEVEVEAETRGRDHQKQLLDALRAAGYPPRNVTT